MKKSIKIILAVIGVLLIGTYLAYSFCLLPDPGVKQQLVKEFGSEFFDPNQKAPQQQKEKMAEQPTPITNEALQKIDEKYNDSDLEMEKKIEQQKQIVDKYLPRFSNLEQVSVSRLNTLYAAGLQECQEQKNNGTLNKVALARKYLTAVQMLEQNVDTSFNSNLEEMKGELEAQGLSTAIIEDIDKDYKQAKSNQRSELLKRATAQIKN